MYMLYFTKTAKTIFRIKYEHWAIVRNGSFRFVGLKHQSSWKFSAFRENTN